jgi:hypothetical protein
MSLLPAAAIPVTLLLTMVTSRVELFHGELDVPRSEWRALSIPLHERPATVEAKFRVLQGDSRIRILVLTKKEADRFQQGQRPQVLASSERSAEGVFQYVFGAPDDYELLIDNRLESGEPARVEMEVSLLYNEFTSFDPKTLTRDRRLTVIFASLAVFALVGGWSGWKLFPAVSRRRRLGRPTPWL